MYIHQLLQPIGQSPMGNRKEIAPLIAAGLISGGAGLLGTLFSGRSSSLNTDSTNRANQIINEQQLAASRRQFEDQMAENRYLTGQARAWQRSDIEDERRYNEMMYQKYQSIDALKQQYLSAGLNPSLMFGSGGNTVAPMSSAAGTAPQGSTPQGSVPGMIPMQQSPYVDYGQSFSQFASLLQQARYGESDVALRKMDVLTRLIDSLDNLSKVKGVQMNSFLKKFVDSDDGVLSKVLSSVFSENGDFFDTDTADAGTMLLREQARKQLYDSTTSEVTALFQQELNERQRKEWQQSDGIYEQQLKLLVQQVQEYVLDNEKQSWIWKNGGRDVIARQFDYILNGDPVVKKLSEWLQSNPGTIQTLIGYLATIMHSRSPFDGVLESVGAGHVRLR